MQTDSARRAPSRLVRSSALAPALFAALVAFGALSTSGCVRYRAPPQVPLVYRAQTSTPDALKSLQVAPGTKVHIAKIVDDRPDTKTIGENVEQKSRPLPVYGVEQSAPAFLDSVMTTELGRAGISIVDRPEEATLVIATTLGKFFVTEAETYTAEISAKVEVRDKSGKTVFTGRITGVKTQWGKSLSPPNYQEVLGKAAVDFLGNLASNPGFKKVLAGT